MTLCVEFPVILASLGGLISNKRRFALSIVMANALTTAIVAVMERVLARGMW